MISVIAVLAVAVLSSINPVEQINKAKDTASKSDASEVLNAMERYYATFGCYPWEATGTSPNKKCPASYTYAAQGTVAIGSVTGLSVLQELVDKSEVKPQLQTRLTAQADYTKVNALAVTGDSSQLVHVCFKASSKTFTAQANGDASGAVGTTYVCVP